MTLDFRPITNGAVEDAAEFPSNVDVARSLRAHREENPPHQLDVFVLEDPGGH